jgi:hypothetical protein
MTSRPRSATCPRVDPSWIDWNAVVEPAEQRQRREQQDGEHARNQTGDLIVLPAHRERCRE